MHESSLITIQIAVLVLLLVACLAAIAAKYLKFPYTVGLVLIGAGLGWASQHLPVLESLQTVMLTHDLILFLFLPPLIFESAQGMDFRLLSHNLFPVGILAGPGLLVSTAIVGLLLSWLTPLDFLPACLFGALISATDPVAVIALFKELGVPQRLSMLVEGESLFNDATAIVTFNIILATLASGSLGWAGVGGGLVLVVKALVGGVGIGLVTAAVLGYLITLSRNNALIQATLSAIVAYTTFLVAEEGLHVSGVIAVMTVGLVVGWLNTSRVSPEVRNFLGEFWEYGAFLANSLIFLLIGLNTVTFVDQMDWSSSWRSIVWAIVIALVSRAIVVYGLMPLINLFEHSPISWDYQTVSIWGGLRGAVALALVLSLDLNFPDRDLIMVLTLAVVLFTILTSGSTMGALIHGLELDRPAVFDRLAQAEAQLEAKWQGLREIQALETQPLFSATALAPLHRAYEQAVTAAEQALATLWLELHQTPGLIEQAVWSQAIAIERQGYQTLRDQGFISAQLLDRLRLMTDLKQDAIRAGKIPPPQRLASRSDPRLVTWLTHLERRLIPAHPSTWERERQLEARYSYDLAIADVNGEVAKRIQELGEEIGSKTANLPNCQGIDTTPFQGCSEAYTTFSKAAFLTLSLGQSQTPEIAAVLQQKIAFQAALLREERTIEHLRQEGTLSATVAAKIQHQLTSAHHRTSTIMHE